MLTKTWGPQPLRLWRNMPEDLHPLRSKEEDPENEQMKTPKII